MYKVYTTELAGRKLSLEFGKYCGQANGSVIVRLGDTVVMVNATAAEKPREGQDFFPPQPAANSTASAYQASTGTSVFFLPNESDDFGRDATHHGVGRHVFRYHRPGGDNGSVPDGDAVLILEVTTGVEKHISADGDVLPVVSVEGRKQTEALAHWLANQL